MAKPARLLTYSTIADSRVKVLATEQGLPDTQLLQQIQQALSAAASNYLSRQYQDAIGDYQQASTLIWSQLDPATKPWVAKFDPTIYNLDQLAPLLQASLGWLGLLNVPGPTSPVSPPAGSGPVTIVTSPFDEIGLSSGSSHTPQGLAAAASARLSQLYARQGSLAASKQFRELATEQDAEVATAYLGIAETAETAETTIATTAPATAPAPATAATTAQILAELAAEAQAAMMGDNSGDGTVVMTTGGQRPGTTVGSTPPAHPLPISLTQQRQLSVISGPITDPHAVTKSFSFEVGSAPDHAAILQDVYRARIDLIELPDVLAQPLVASDLVLALPHIYYFVVPVGLGDCYAALGDWERAEAAYLNAIGYDYLNADIEAPQLWAKLASLYVNWADSLYRDGDPVNALPLYLRVVSQAGTQPDSVLYRSRAIAPGAQLAAAVFPILPQLLSDPSSIPQLDAPAVAAPILDAFIKASQIAASLDFYGHWAPVVPIWTFGYLQQVATQYCQYAVTTEQNVINYWDRADQAKLTRLQLTQHVSDSHAEIQLATRQLDAARYEATAYQKGVDLATLRANLAKLNADDYQAMQGVAISYSAASSAVSGGEDGDPGYLNSLVDQLQQGNFLAGSPAQLSAADQLAASRLSMQYEVASMHRTEAEMWAAAGQARAELVAAQARQSVAAGQLSLATLQAREAEAVLEAFDDATFTAGVWKAMGDRLYSLYRRYLGMALRAAKLAQRAYNFENDAELQVIRADYSADEVHGLLAADALMADLASITDTQLADQRSKLQPISHTVSLARRHSYLFETQFRKTGTISFDTSPDDFDLAYPGSYSGRVRAVSVAVQGLTPTAGISGTLSCGGLSFYRTPTDTWAETNPAQLRCRVQTPETLVLSGYDRRSDLIQNADGQSGTFAGAGVIGNWTLQLPPEVNDLDYNLITDVLITFDYEARFDPDLATRVTAQLASQPGAQSTQLGLPLRWLYPDTFFDLVNNHTATLRIARADLPLNQAAPTISLLGLLVTTSGGHSAQGLTIEVSAPGAAAASAAATDQDGLISSAVKGSPLAAQHGRPVVGEWTLTVPIEANPAWLTAGALDLTALANLTVLLEYSYTPRASA